MPRFIFNLEALLDLRRHEERAHRLSVAAIERQRIELEEAVRACQAEIRSHKADLSALLAGDHGGAVHTRSVRLQSTAALHAGLRTQGLALRLAGVYRRLEDARRELTAAAARRRAVELLRARRYEAWKRAIDRREAAELDEIGTIRAARTPRD